MGKLRIVIVDDSPFSISLIKGILKENGYDVVGEASNLPQVKEVIARTNPDLVTMDMTLPGTDGFECTKAIHQINKDIKVIIISSMKDEELLREARRNRVSGYIQKPIDREELISTIQKLTEEDELFEFLQKYFMDAFSESFTDATGRMAGITVEIQEEVKTQKDLLSKGMTIIISIIGRFSGRMLLDLPKETAEKFASKMLQKEIADQNEVVNALAEFSNIVAGNACSLLNRQKMALGLRLAPPSIMHGDSLYISTPDYSTFSVTIDTVYGNIVLNAGFKKGEEKWM